MGSTFISVTGDCNLILLVHF